MSMRHTLLCVPLCLLAAGCMTTVPVARDEYSREQRVVMTFKNDDVIEGKIAEGSNVHYTNEGLLYRARVATVDDDKIVLEDAELLSDDSPRARQAKLEKLERRRAELAESSNPAPVPIEQIKALQADLDTLRAHQASDKQALAQTQSDLEDKKEGLDLLGSAASADSSARARILDVRDRLVEAVNTYQNTVQSMNDERQLLVNAGLYPTEIDSLRARFGPLTEDETELIRTERQYRQALEDATKESEERERLGRRDLLEAGRNKEKQAAAQKAIDAARQEQTNIRAKQRERDAQIYPLVTRTRYNDAFEMADAYQKWVDLKEKAKGYLHVLDRLEQTEAQWRQVNAEAIAMAGKWGVSLEPDKGVPIPVLDDLAQRMGLAVKSQGEEAALQAEVQRLNADLADLQSHENADLQKMTDLLRQSGIQVTSVPDVEQSVPAYEDRWTRYVEWKHLNDVEIPKYERLLQVQVPYAGPERDRLVHARVAVTDTIAPVVLPKDQIQSIEEIRLDRSKTSLRVGFWGYAAIVLGMLVSERS